MAKKTTKKDNPEKVINQKLQTHIALVSGEYAGYVDAVELYRKAGIDGASSHSGRRGFIPKLAHSGVSAKVIMELAGHKHLGTTQRYIEVNDEMKRAAVEIL